MNAPTRPFAPFEWMLALRYLRAKRAESFISVISVISLIGIALGVATLIIVMSVMNGFRHELLGKMLGLQGHVVVQGTEGGLPNFDIVAARMRAVPGVTRVAPVVDGEAMASANGRNTGALVRGLGEADLKAFTIVSSTLSAGALQHYEDGNSVIVGARLAQDLRLVPGMPITLISARGDVTPFGTTPRIKTYKVAGTFEIGMSRYNSSYIFMPLSEAQLYFNMDNTVTGIEAMIDNPDKVNSFVVPIQQAAGPTARVVTWHDWDPTFFDAVNTERVVMFLILTLIIIVAALNIVSELYMLVKDKSADIAILRTMGASRGAIMRIFMIAGISIGVTGTLIGFLIGVVFCANIEIHPPVPLHAHRHHLIRSHRLFPEPHAGRDGPGRCRVRGVDVADLEFPCNTLSRMACGAARSGGGAAL